MLHIILLGNDVQTQLIVTVGAVAVALIGAMVAVISNKKTGTKIEGNTHTINTNTSAINTIEDKIGKPNGHGSLTHMMEEILSIAVDTSRRVTRLEERSRSNSKRMGEINSHVEALDGRMESILVEVQRGHDESGVTTTED
ncbi:MAG: hypothetical protein ABL876_00230 [Chitinophagaceae bacterium]